MSNGLILRDCGHCDGVPGPKRYGYRKGLCDACVKQGVRLPVELVPGRPCLLHAPQFVTQGKYLGAHRVRMDDGTVVTLKPVRGGFWATPCVA